MKSREAEDTRSVDPFQVDSCGAVIMIGLQFERPALALGNFIKPGSLHRGDVQENLGLLVIARDEPPTAVGAYEFDGSFWHYALTLRVRRRCRL